jgi:succinate dehydrogenase flavin-adding protein (antitoxin of CptAB toxin-antitoxin module)
VTKSVYIIDYWVPFPQSEYGGVVTLIAEDDNEAFELCASEEGFPKEYVAEIMMSIVKAQKLPLAEEYDSAIIDAFTT